MFEKVLKGIALSAESADIMTKFTVELLKLADKYGVDRDEHIRDICASFTFVCHSRSFKDFKIDEGEDEE